MYLQPHVLERNSDKRLTRATMLGVSLLFLSPLLGLSAPSPFASDFRGGISPVHLTLAAYALLGAGISGFLLASRVRWLAVAIRYVPISITVYCLLSQVVVRIQPTTEVAALLLAITVFFAGVYFAMRRYLLVPTASGTILTCTTVLTLALLLHVIPPNALLPQVNRVPPLFDPIDRGHYVYQQHGFRGVRPCLKDCPPGVVRVFTMGGSSTNGVPMVAGNRTYSAELQRILEERRVGEQYEVLNAGIAGHGLVQVYAALQEELLKYSPDIVIVNLWFNDSGPAPGWYGIPGVSDMEAYQRVRLLRALQDLPVYREIRQTRLYAFLRHYLTGIRARVAEAMGVGTVKRGHRARMTPEEYGALLAQIAELGKEHDFLPVFVTEPLNRSRSLVEELPLNPYLRELQVVADSYDLPYVDTLTPLQEVHSEWLFYDFIHPNPQGHAIVAETIFQSLFFEPTEVAKQHLASRGVQVEQPLARRESRKQFSVEALPQDGIVIKARTPLLSNGSAQLVVRDDKDELLRLAGLEREWQEFRVPSIHLATSRPILDLYFSADVAQVKPGASYQVGATNALSPVPLVIESGGKDFGWSVAIRVNNVRYDYDHRGYNAAIVGGQTGTVLKTAFFDLFASAGENEKISRFIDAAGEFVEEGKPPIVIVALKTDGFHQADRPLLGQAFRKIGGSGATPEYLHSFLLVGVPGATPGTAIEKVGPAFQRVVVGRVEDARGSLVEVEIPPGQGLL